MGETGLPLPSLVICGAVATEVDAVERTVRECSGWTVVPIRWPDRASLSAAHQAGARGYLLVGSIPSDLVEAMKGRAETSALILLGSEYIAPDLGAVCWLPRIPPSGFLAMLLAQLVSARPSAKNWRRKSDMIIGQSPAIEQLLQTLDRIAPSAASTLVTGESGTGKELVARALHYSGPRANAPFIAVNCAAIPESLFESELFGHARGAFTGAVASRAGVFEAADGGTLFLDELGEMPLSLQPKLLRVLETGEVMRLGSTEVRKTNVRLVAATNRSLDDDVVSGRFREDLYYRVRVFHVNIPALRERPEDIPPIVSHHLGRIADRDKRAVPVITRAALERLLRHRWPGNVRELVNALERASILAQPAGTIDAEHILLPEDSPSLIHSYRDAREQFEAVYYSQLLRTTGGNVSMAAKLANRTRKQVYDALRRLELDPSRFRSLEPRESS